MEMKNVKCLLAFKQMPLWILQGDSNTFFKNTIWNIFSHSGNLQTKISKNMNIMTRLFNTMIRYKS